MKYRIRSLLILVSLITLLTPILFRYFNLATQPKLSVTSTAKYTEYEFPYVNCISVHDDPWGRVRIVVLHRVTSESYALANSYPDWVDPNYATLPLRINGNEIFAQDDVLVYFAEDGDSPELARISLSKVPLDDPWWPKPDKLWNIVTGSNVESNW